MAALVAFEAFDVLFGAGTSSNVCHVSGLTIGSLLGLSLRRQLAQKEEQEKEKGK
jgi:membrane associated rhomboid family serine protease